MRNVNLVFAVVLFVIFALTSCQKEGLQEMNNLTEQVASENLKDASSILEKAMSMADEAKAIQPSKSNKATSRTNPQLVYEATTTLDSDQLDLFFINKSAFPDPKFEKYEVYLTPLTGDVDLHISGTDGTGTSWRLISQSATTTGQEYATVRGSDLLNTEVKAYISVIGNAGTQYRIQVFKSDVDCLERPPAQANLLYTFDPVCSCDGRPFGNWSEAWAAGYTEWTTGSCIEDGRYRNVELSNPTADLIINRITISNDAQTIKFRSRHCINPNNPACNWLEVPLTYDVALGKWVAHAERGTGQKQMKIDVEITKNGDLLEVDASFIGNFAYRQHETFEKV